MEKQSPSRFLRAAITAGISLLICAAAGAAPDEAQKTRRPVQAPAPADVKAQAGNDRLLMLRAAVFDPLKEQPRFDGMNALKSGNGRYGIVQFHPGRAAEAKRALADQGVTFLGYIPNNAWQVRWTPDGRQRLAAHPAVRWAGSYRPGFKIDPALNDSSKARGRVALTVAGFHRADMDRVVREIGSRFGKSTLTARMDRGPQPKLRFELPAAKVDAFVRTAAQLDDVAWIEPYRQPRLLNADSVGPLQSDLPTAGATNATIWAQDLIGTGQIVTVADSGLDRNLCWFTQLDNGESVNNEITDAADVLPPLAGPTFPQRKVAGYWLMPGAEAYESFDALFNPVIPAHGTHVIGTVLGDRGTASTPTEPNFLRTDEDGMAPNAQVIVQDIGNLQNSLTGIPADDGDLFRQARAGGSFIHSDSWGASTAGAYGSSDQNVDAALWALEDMLVLFAAGNDGPVPSSTGSPSNAKNNVSVGATDHGDLPTTAAFSSRGPTADGRYAPDVMAPGVATLSARNDADDVNPGCPSPVEAGQNEGTSMATPAVAGMAALMRQYFTDGFYPTGARNAADERIPSGPVMKAVLLNGTRDLGGMPNNDNGWGRVFLDNNLFFGNSPTDRRLRVWGKRNVPGLVTGEVDEYDVQVGAGAEFRVTLTWYDAPGTLGTARALVNNLDLEVEGPIGGLASQVYRGNDMAAGESLPGGSADNVNVTETVRLLAPEPGLYRIRVIATDIPGTVMADTDRQGYGLAASYANCSGGVADEPANLQASDNGDTGIDVSFDPVAGATAYNIYRADGNCSADPSAFRFVGTTDGTQFTDDRALGGFQYAYRVRGVDACTEGPLSSACSSAQSTASCFLDPDFDLASVTAANEPGTSQCDIEISWDAGTSNCPLGDRVRYNVYRSTQPDFELGAGTLLAAGVDATSFVDNQIQPLTTYYYAVQAEDTTSDGEGPANGGNISVGKRIVKATASAATSSPGTFIDSADQASFMSLEDPWRVTFAQSASGQGSYRNAPDGQTYPNDTCAAMTTPPIELPAGGAPQLSYAARYDLEPEWDGVVVEISTDGGQSWQDLPPAEGYPGNFASTGNPPINACGYAASHGAFNGDSGGAFQSFSNDLSHLAGQTIQLRWRFSSDPATQGGGAPEDHGLFLDDMQITDASVPDACEAVIPPPIVQEDVTAQIELHATNPAFGGGAAAFDLDLENGGSDLAAPIDAEVVALSSSSGTVTVANADNDEPGVGALFGYQGLLGGDDTLSFGERSDPRRPAFNNPQNEMFSVTFRVLAVASSSGQSKALSIQDGKRVGDSLPGTTTAAFPDLPDGVFYRVTVNPLLGTVLVELID